MKNELRKKNGITLIALVITIIVLLVLAGVTIAMISSQDGILNKATSTKEANKKASEEEYAKLEIQAALIDGEGTIDVSKLTADSDIVKAYTDNGYTYKGEGKFISKDGDEEITITKEGNIEKIAVISDVSKLTTAVTKMTKYVDNTSTINKEAIIPRGFKVSSVTEEQKKDTGLVVIDKNGNEFVWVPVPDAVYDGTTTITVGTYTPMARKIGDTENYQGVLYDLNQTKENQKVFDLLTYRVGTTNRREPSLITNSGKDTSALLDTIEGTKYDAQYYNQAGNYSDAKAFGKDMQGEYNNMVKSVAKYGGFYVGRYETGIDNTSKKAVSKNATEKDEKGILKTTTADASQTDTKMWYGLYNKQRTMAKDNGLDSVESSMIWGSQYDAMMIWMQKTGTTIGIGYNTTKANTEKVTGNLPTDIINKVYDLYGCHREWTLESHYSSDRIYRGGVYDNDNAPSYRSDGDPGNNNNSRGSRLSLYIK